MNETRNLNQDEYEIDLRELWYLFRAKFKFIVLFAILGALIAGLITYFLIIPKYKATSKLYVVSASNDSVVNLTDLQIGSNLTQDYKELILGRPMLESCIKDLNLNYTVGELKDMITVSNPSNTRIIEITATTIKPELSRDIANKMASLATSWLPEVMESNKPHVAENAIAPSTPSSPSMIKNCVIGAAGLGFLYFAICVIKNLLDDTVKTAGEMEKYFGFVPLAVVPEVNKKGLGK